MKRCAFLTMDDTAGWSIDADLAFGPLADLGWYAEWVPWRQRRHDWDRFSAVYLAATWDYPDDVTRFLDVLATIGASGAVLVNDFDTVVWNLSKSYLEFLERAGVPVLPSRFFEDYADCDLDAEFDRQRCRKLVVKPLVGTNAVDTFVLERPVSDETREALAAIFAARPLIVQPFMEGIRDEGEYSLFWIGDRFSHGIRKVPAPGDFRVQEEHGAAIEAVEPTAELLRAGGLAMKAVPGRPLYGRCDFVRDARGALRVMEVELIEPSLYLRMDDGAPRRFAEALDRHVSAQTALIGP